jgi:hypothetical protein
MRTLACACLLLALATRPALAAESALALAQQVQASRQLYSDGDFGAAVERLQKLVAQTEPRPRSEERRRSLADAYFYLALSYAAMGDPDTATDAFVNVLRLDAGRRVDPEVYAPKVVALFENARAVLDQRVTDRDVSRAGAAPPTAHRGLALFGEVDGAAIARWQFLYPLAGRLDDEPNRHARLGSQPRGWSAAVEVGVRIHGRHSLTARRAWSRSDDEVSFTSPVLVNNPQGFHLSEAFDVDVSEIGWRSDVLLRRRVRWFAEIGFRHTHTGEVLECPANDVANSTSSAHWQQAVPDRRRVVLDSRSSGPRAGAGVELRLSPRWSVSARVGLALMSASAGGSETVREAITDGTAMTDITWQLKDARTTYRTWDGVVSGRGQLTRHLYVQLGYSFSDYGPAATPVPWRTSGDNVEFGPRCVVGAVGASLGIELGR